jgi:methyl-accepting chemotaxis protein
MRSLRIGPRIYLIVGLLVVTGIVSYAIASQGMNDVRATYDSAFKERAPVTRVIDGIRATLPDINLQVWTMLVADMPKDFFLQQVKDMDAFKQDMRGYVADWEKNAVKGATAPEETKFKALAATFGPYFAAIDAYDANILVFVNKGDKAARAAAFKSNDTSGAVDTAAQRVEAALADLVKVNEAENRTVQAEAEAEQQAAMTRLGLVIGIMLLVGIAAAMAIAASIIRPLRDAVRFADTVAAGDLSAKIGSHAGGETGELTRAVEAMKESLVERVDQLREVAAVVELAAEGVTSTASDVIAEARSGGNEVLAQKGERLAAQAGNLKSALSAFKGAESE